MVTARSSRIRTQLVALAPSPSRMQRLDRTESAGMHRAGGHSGE